MKKNNHYPCYEMPEIKDFRHFVDFMRESYKDDVAFMFEVQKQNTEVTYAKFTDDIDRLAAYFVSAGLNDERIALYGENSYEWIVTYFAAICSGNVIVPIDKEIPGAEVANLVNDCAAKILVYSNAKASVIEEVKAEMPSVESFENISGFDVLFEKGAALISAGEVDVKALSQDVDKMCALIYTSGTTGNPKGVMLCQRNLLFDMVNSCRNLLEPRDTVVVLPLNHTFGMMAGVLCQVYAGYKTYINNNLRNVLRDINTLKPRHISVVPLFADTFYKGIWKNAKKSGKYGILKSMLKVSNALRKVGIDLRRVLFKSVIDAFGGRLEMLIVGGAPLDLAVAKGFEDLGITVIGGYGITECSPIVSTDRNLDYKFGSAGLPIPGVEVKVDNPDEKGEGELLIKGPIVMLGYYNNPEATAEVFAGDWFRTGDIGKIDDEGFIFITGRKKNIIITPNGKNVYPEEIEAVVQRVEGVGEVLVFDDNGLICAEIYTELKDEQDRIKREVQALNKTLPSYKQIQKVVFRDTEFEKTTTKKIKRFLRG
ncbi:MAG: AMP-binding protein [Clostridia bacterium]|nr:AMP-binding protein [Clostridia bacterium]